MKSETCGIGRKYYSLTLQSESCVRIQIRTKILLIHNAKSRYPAFNWVTYLSTYQHRERLTNQTYQLLLAIFARLVDYSILQYVQNG